MLRLRKLYNTENKKLKELSAIVFLIVRVDISILQSVEYQNSETRKTSTEECSRDPGWIPQICVSSWNPLLNFSRKLYLSPCVVESYFSRCKQSSRQYIRNIYDPLPFPLLAIN